MQYSFELVGIAPILNFFNHQYNTEAQRLSGAEYLATHRCTLDAFLESAETVVPERGWNLDRVVDDVIEFWLNNAEQVNHWKQRLQDAGADTLLIGRLGDYKAMQIEFESLLGK
ncbi:MAG: hypothetical protein KME20_02630 [Kaiparowitsia implicata GSE-PSE-MK54-09C]|jgi:plasmid maintenance system antidote protein VapI|nr:hypothetical protein [Kaiparowitsia implicata GSE-PSE-MK54-09C]